MVKVFKLFTVHYPIIYRVYESTKTHIKISTRFYVGFIFLVSRWF